MTGTYPEDFIFIESLKSGDEAAFGQLVKTYQGVVYNLVYRMIGSLSEAEDIAQDIFIIVFKEIQSFRGECKLSSWIYRIAVNTILNKLKYLSRRKYKNIKTLEETDLSKINTDYVVNQSPAPDEALQVAQLEKVFETALDQLEEQYKLVIVLRDVQQLTYSEIVEITGLPEGTVKSRLHTARLLLKEMVKAYL